MLRKPLFWIINILVLMLLCGLACGPIFLSMAAGTFGEAIGCPFNESAAPVCQFNGQDIGGTLYTLGMLGFISIGTLPLALIIGGVYLVVLVIFLVTRKPKN